MDNKHLNGYIDEERNEIAAEAAAPNHYPTCRYCGKQTIPTAAYESDDIADEAATMACDCAGSREYRYQKEQAEKREKNIAKLKRGIDDIADYLNNRNINITDELHSVLVMAGTAVIDGHVGSATLKFARATVSVSKNGKGVVIIKVAYADGAQIEV